MPASSLRLCAAALFAVLASSSALATDPWDDAPPGDDTESTTVNLLWHTLPEQAHDIEAVGGVADIDWFVIVPIARRSYEVQLGGGTGTTGVDSLRLQRMDAASLVLQNSSALGNYTGARTLRWMEPSPTASRRIRVASTSTTANADSKYTIKLRETTMYCPRFNNSGTQVSVLLAQNAAPELASCAYDARFVAANGTEVGTSQGTLSTASLLVLNISTVVPATSGSAYIAHTCGWGGIKAKVTTLEPATGFSFDTECSPREP